MYGSTSLGRTSINEHVYPCCVSILKAERLHQPCYGFNINSPHRRIDVSSQPGSNWIDRVYMEIDTQAADNSVLDAGFGQCGRKAARQLD